MSKTITQNITGDGNGSTLVFTTGGNTSESHNRTSKCYITVILDQSGTLDGTIKLEAGDNSFSSSADIPASEYTENNTTFIVEGVAGERLRTVTSGTTATNQDITFIGDVSGA